jgi:ABC-2 type transport system permease protein
VTDQQAARPAEADRLATPAAGPTGAGRTTTERGADGAPGYRPQATLSLRAEAIRQLTRRRTQIALGFLVVLPLVLLGAFLIGVEDDDNDAATRGVSLVDVATASAANFTLFTLFASSTFLLVVVVALFCGDTVASEASWGSLRYLLAAPVPRARLLRQKLLVALGYSAFALVLLPTVAMAAGAVAWGWEPLRTPVGEQIPAGAAVLRIALAVGYIGVTLLMVGSLAFLLSVSTDAPLGAVGGAVMLYISSNILDSVEALGDLRAVLPTRYNLAWLNALSSPIQTDEMVKGCISALVYSTIFLALAWRKFTRKDIVS